MEIACTLCVGVCGHVYTEPSTEKEYESLLMLEEMENMMVQVIKEANHLKKGIIEINENEAHNLIVLPH